MLNVLLDLQVVAIPDSKINEYEKTTPNPNYSTRNSIRLIKTLTDTDAGEDITIIFYEIRFKYSEFMNMDLQTLANSVIDIAMGTIPDKYDQCAISVYSIDSDEHGLKNDMAIEKFGKFNILLDTAIKMRSSEKLYLRLEGGMEVAFDGFVNEHHTKTSRRILGIEEPEENQELASEDFDDEEDDDDDIDDFGLAPFGEEDEDDEEDEDFDDPILSSLMINGKLQENVTHHSKKKKNKMKYYGKSYSFRDCDSPKKAYCRHGVMVAEHKDAIERDRKIIKRFLKDFIPGDQGWKKEFRNNLVDRWISTFVISESKLKKIQKKYKQAKKNKKRSATANRLVALTNTMFNRKLDNHWSDPNR